MGKFTSETAREMQERSVAKRKENQPDKEAMNTSLHNVVEEITTPCDSLKDFVQRVKNKKGATPAERITYDRLSNPKTAYEALQDIYDRVLGKPKQAEPTQIDITTGGKAFTGFSSVLPSVPGIEDICAKIDEEREKQNNIDE
jgi:hypothetical protein